MDEHQKLDQTNTASEITAPLVEPISAAPDNGFVVSEPPVLKVTRFQLIPKVLVVGSVVAILAVFFLSGQHLLTRNIKPTTTVSTKKQSFSTNADVVTKVQPQITSTPTPSTPDKIATKPKTPALSPTPVPPPSSAPNTTNCLPPNPNSYATTYTNMTNSQYLQTNSYSNTTKFYAALQFAGLIGTINTKQYVVLAMDDSRWGNFTPTQLNWMNASPANMRSVIGWQIITSCITWNGVNPVKDMAAGATLTVNSLNGTVTFTSGVNGLGKFGNGPVGIWDWFTSNGSVTIAGFVNLSSIP